MKHVYIFFLHFVHGFYTLSSKWQTARNRIAKHGTGKGQNAVDDCRFGARQQNDGEQNVENAKTSTNDN